jgi:PilZ domain
MSRRLALQDSNSFLIDFFAETNAMAFGARKAERVHFQHEHPVTLMAVDGTWRRSCILKDASETGARLEVDGSTDVLTSREFFMVLSSKGLAFRRCELVWINGSTVGVHFVLSSRKKQASRAPERDVTK